MKGKHQHGISFFYLFIFFSAMMPRFWLLMPFFFSSSPHGKKCMLSHWAKVLVFALQMALLLLPPPHARSDSGSRHAWPTLRSSVTYLEKNKGGEKSSRFLFIPPRRCCSLFEVLTSATRRRRRPRLCDSKLAIS